MEPKLIELLIEIKKLIDDPHSITQAGLIYINSDDVIKLLKNAWPEDEWYYWEKIWNQS